jgi:hypothetical protein
MRYDSELSIKKYSQPIDGFSASSFSVGLGEISELLRNRLDGVNFNEKIGVRVGDLRPSTDF